MVEQTLAPARMHVHARSLGPGGTPVDSETIYGAAVHGQLDPAVESGLEATIGASLRHWVITTEDIHGRVVTIMPNDQYPHVSRDLAQRTVDRLS